MLVNKIMEQMIYHSNGNIHDINHFIKVASFARIIGKNENIDNDTLETLIISAIVHDIACPLYREKYGNTNGQYQEEEGPTLAREFLSMFDLDHDKIERICYLVGHHHTYTNVDGIDYQILLEADFLVNIDESQMITETIVNIKNNIFKTKTGISLLKDMYLKNR